MKGAGAAPRAHDRLERLETKGAGEMAHDRARAGKGSNAGRHLCDGVVACADQDDVGGGVQSADPPGRAGVQVRSAAPPGRGIEIGDGSPEGGRGPARR